MDTSWKPLALASAAAGLLALAGAFGFVMPRAQAALDVRYPPAPARLDTASASKGEGERLTYVLGCRACHAKDLTGAQMTLSSSTLAAPNLTLLAKRSDAELDAALRQGLRPDGRSELAMPSQAYAGLTDAQASAVIAYLRGLTPSGPPVPQPPYGFLLRMNLATGALKTQAVRVKDAQPPIDAGPTVETGRRLASLACGQCHATDLKAGSGYPAPDLTIRGYYDRKQFHKVMRTGEGLPRDMKLMAEVAASSLSHLTDPEIDALYDYLIARDEKLAAKPKP